jgi:DNA polymerase
VKWIESDIVPPKGHFVEGQTTGICSTFWFNGKESISLPRFRWGFSQKIRNLPVSRAFERPMDREQLTVILKQHLKSWSRAGVTHLPLAAGIYGDPFAQLPTHSEVSLVREASPETSMLNKANAAGSVSREAPLAGPTSASHSVTLPPHSRDDDTSHLERTGAIAAAANLTPGSQFNSPRPAPVSLDIRPYGMQLDLATRQNNLTTLSAHVAACQRCEILAKCRTQTVFGVGNPQARLCFFGEAPGQDEDQAGEPFVGAAGQLLNRIMEACRLSREDVYILNTIKCRPPENRNPTELEQQNCWEYAEQQLEIIQPEFICCLGRIAAQALLKTSIPVGRLRGTFHRYRSSQVVVTYHPAYLLRTPSAKKQTWDDMKMLMEKMGVQL